MTLEKEISNARKEIISDGYDMSVGEVMNLYRDSELIINPAFQRLFRWDESQKTRFIESLLLGIPIPPIFVVQDESGIWELIDGLQRLSTVLEFSGLLRDDNGELLEPSVLAGTTLLPSLAGKKWEPSNPDAIDEIGKSQQLQIKRARLRVEILKKESDPKAKFELFERLNTGGAQLTPQEVRNSVAVMINPGFYTWLAARSNNVDFVKTTNQTQAALDQQMGVELALRFLVFRSVPYVAGLDIHEFLDKALRDLATNELYPIKDEELIFDSTFEWLNKALGENAFKRLAIESDNFSGKFLMSAFEVISIGVSKNYLALKAMSDDERNTFLVARIKKLWGTQSFIEFSGGGVRGTTRLSNLLPVGEPFFKP